jgi:pimeloyl-ACP methyl ester carboxylesterase
VLIHGFGDSANTWNELAAELDVIGDVHRWDLPGHGARLADPAGLMHRDAAVAEIAGRTEMIGDRVVLVGHSLGGYLALALTIKHPQLVSSLTLVSSGPGFRDPDARARWNGYMDAVAAKNGLDATVARLGHQDDSWVIDNLPTITCPLLHILGGGDTRYRAGADYLQRVLPTSRIITIPEAGHHPHVSHASTVAAAMAQQTSHQGS